MPAGVYKHKPSQGFKIGNKLGSTLMGVFHPSWKGEKAKYQAKHIWIRNMLGNAKKCHDCGTTEGRIEWSNIDHKYRRVTEDYIQRCKSCHNIYDINVLGKYAKEISCHICNTIFVRKNHNAKYCSFKCYVKNRYLVTKVRKRLGLIVHRIK